MKRYYAGIGSRETPEEIIKIMIQIAESLGKKGVILRSGAAEGADTAFEVGCDNVNGRKEIYLPWRGFGNSNSTLIVKDSKAFELVEKYHPGYLRLSQGALKLQARNSHQVLGLDLNTPSDFIVCYTPKGKGSGGTGQALRIAKDYSIPVFDCGLYEDDLELLKKEYLNFLKDTFKNALEKQKNQLES